MRTVLVTFAAVLVICAAGICRAADLTPDQTFSFADHLYGERDFYRAISEYERFLYFFPDHPLAKTARYQIGMSYLRGEKSREAVRWFEDVAERYPKDDVGKQALIRTGDAYYQGHDYPQASAAYERFLRTFANDPDADGVRIKRGWCRLRQGNWRGAAQAFEDLPATSPLREQGQWLAAEARAYPDIARKSPALAGTLSAVLPGAGQLYLGRKYDALISFLMNGVFIAASVEAVHHRSATTAGVLLFFESGWYFGNIYSAVSSAHKYNRDKQQDYLDRMSSQYGLALIRDERRTTVVALTMRF